MAVIRCGQRRTIRQWTKSAEMPARDLLEICGADGVEVVIRSDGKALRVNTSEGCRLYISKIFGKIIIKDERTDEADEAQDETR